MAETFKPGVSQLESRDAPAVSVQQSVLEAPLSFPDEQILHRQMEKTLQAPATGDTELEKITEGTIQTATPPAAKSETAQQDSAKEQLRRKKLQVWGDMQAYVLAGKYMEAQQVYNGVQNDQGVRTDGEFQRLAGYCELIPKADPVRSGNLRNALLTGIKSQMTRLEGVNAQGAAMAGPASTAGSREGQQSGTTAMPAKSAVPSRPIDVTLALGILGANGKEALDQATDAVKQQPTAMQKMVLDHLRACLANNPAKKGILPAIEELENGLISESKRAEPVEERTEDPLVLRIEGFQEMIRKIRLELPEITPQKRNDADEYYERAIVAPREWDKAGLLFDALRQNPDHQRADNALEEMRQQKKGGKNGTSQDTSVSEDAAAVSSVESIASPGEGQTVLAANRVTPEDAPFIEPLPIATGSAGAAAEALEGVVDQDDPSVSRALIDALRQPPVEPASGDSLALEKDKEEGIKAMTEALRDFSVEEAPLAPEERAKDRLDHNGRLGTTIQKVSPPTRVATNVPPRTLQPTAAQLVEAGAAIPPVEAAARGGDGKTHTSEKSLQVYNEKITALSAQIRAHRLKNESVPQDIIDAYSALGYERADLFAKMGNHERAKKDRDVLKAISKQVVVPAAPPRSSFGELQAVVAANPKDYIAHHELARIYHKTGDNEKALEHSDLAAKYVDTGHIQHWKVYAKRLDIKMEIADVLERQRLAQAKTGMYKDALKDAYKVGSIIGQQLTSLQHQRTKGSGDGPRVILDETTALRRAYVKSFKDCARIYDKLGNGEEAQRQRKIANDCEKAWFPQDTPSTDTVADAVRAAPVPGEEKRVAEPAEPLVAIPVTPTEAAEVVEKNGEVNGKAEASKPQKSRLGRAWAWITRQKQE